MFKFLIIISINTILFANQWSNLLHYTNGENQIISNEFFLSEVYNPTPNQELNSTIKLLNSENGNLIACNFPARYSYLKNNNHNIPNFNLNKCIKLSKFINNFGTDKLSLIFTSEYTNNPSSAFGHTMLLFQNNNESFEIGDAVHFAAETSKKDGFLKYSYKGFNGKYKGYFLREPFYKKIYEYNTLEQRYMYIYTLDFNKEDIKQIIYHLYELRKATFKYYFLSGNCATQTTDLLNIINDNKREDKIYYLPIDTIKQYKKNIISKSKFIPLINKLNLLIKKMSKREKKLFYKIINNKEDISPKYPDIVKEAMVYYSTFYFRRFHRVFKNYDSSMNQVYTEQNIKDKSLNPLDKTQPSNIGIGLYANKDNDYLYFHYRPLFIDIFDIQLNSMQQSTVDTFTFDIISNNKNTKLIKFDLANIKSFTTQTKFYKPVSWSIYCGLNRNNIDNGLKINTELGLGKTNSIFKNSIINTMLYLGSDNSEFYIKPYINFNTTFNGNLKGGISTEYKKYSNDYYYLNQGFITLKDNNLIYQIKYENDNSTYSNRLLLSVKYNF